MGISRYYRGNSCNFGATYDGHLELVGATIHLLSKGLDSGDMLYHALPKAQEIDPFVLGMQAVKVGQKSLIERVKDNSIFKYTSMPQDKNKEYRYTKNVDFTDEVAKEYLNKLLIPAQLKEKMEQRDLNLLKDPFIG